RRLDRLRIHLDRALEAGAVLEAHAGGRDVAAHLRALADADALGAVEVAFDEALDVHGSRVDVGPDLALRADRQAVVLQLDGAVDLALDQQVFLAAQVAVDVNGRSNDRGLAGTGAARSRSLAARRLGAVRAQNVVRTFVGPAFLTQVEHSYPHGES